ncbi:GyrI-like domain-containing protein [Plantactinospora sp. ZYX-F-223]|uniref:GyrI-like domain-containing protein n=1 Tax=Plantactinospora sp. ZYX-F-223 TaxID=3144103 RepID=UPI0031FC3FC3
MPDSLTDAELTVLGLVAERPRHGYELEAVIDARGVRQWTALGFSSIYYVLGRLEARDLVSSTRPDGSAKGRRVYTATPAGMRELAAATRRAIAELRPSHPSVLVGIANSPVLDARDVVDALRERGTQVAERLAAVQAARAAQEPVPDFVAAIFDYSLGQLRAEQDWIASTTGNLEMAMTKSDIKRDRKDLYLPRAGRFALVDVPELPFLMIDGKGDPNTSMSYQDAVAALYAVSYAVKFASKQQLGRDYVVGPLEGLWSADDPSVFVTRDKHEWQWTMMVTQPEWVSAAMVEQAIELTAAKKALPALDRLRFERYAEGLSVQVLHVGSYDEEGPVLARLHQEFMPANGLTHNGRHHEIYLSDPRKTEPAKLRTILRQPVARS